MQARDLGTRPTLVCGIALTVLVSGCSGALAPQRTDYEKLPGSGDRMADGPGLIGSQNAENYDRGYTIYSDDPAKQALINPNRNRQTSTPTSAIKSQKAASPSAATTQPTAAQQQDYREFQQYQQFKQLPANSAEYKRFREWQEWKQYQQWRDSESENR